MTIKPSKHAAKHMAGSRRFSFKIMHASFIRVILILLVIHSGCAKKTAEPVENVFYTCSMDPQVMEKHPGICPICHMELTPITITPGERNVVRLSPQQIYLGNIRVDTLKLQGVSDEKTLTGTTAVNAKSIQQISSRVNGRIEQLYFKASGGTVEKGQKLYEIYSEELLAAQKQFLLTAENKTSQANEVINFNALAEAARNKLLLLGMNEEQVADLERKSEPSVTIPIISPVHGSLTNITVHEGDFVNEGSTMFEVVDLSTLWVEAQVYTNELEMLHNQDHVEVMLAAYPGETINGKITFENPELVPQSEINLVRIEIANPQRKYFPGMLAYVTLRGKEARSFRVPSDALIHDSAGEWLWFKNSAGNFERRKINTGSTGSGYTEIISGVNEGDIVVISGAYLLNSEYLFKRGTLENIE